MKNKLKLNRHKKIKLTPGLKPRTMVSAIVILATALVLALVIIVFQNSRPSLEQQIKITKSSADDLKLQAIRSMSTDKDKAKQLFTQAREQYETINDQNGVVDVNAQIYYIDHVND